MSEPDHKYDFGQELYVETPMFTGIVKVLAKPPYCCTTHGSDEHPVYGVAAGDRHFGFCEALLTPIGRRN